MNGVKPLPRKGAFRWNLSNFSEVEIKVTGYPAMRRLGHDLHRGGPGRTKTTSSDATVGSSPPGTNERRSSLPAVLASQAAGSEGLRSIPGYSSVTRG
eukprot:2484483-Rhodomonas_salina.1